MSFNLSSTFGTAKSNIKNSSIIHKINDNLSKPKYIKPIQPPAYQIPEHPRYPVTPRYPSPPRSKIRQPIYHLFAVKEKYHKKYKKKKYNDYFSFITNVPFNYYKKGNK